MRGVILAGGDGGALGPLTRAAPAHLLPVGDKPMVYFPLSALMLAGVREVLVCAPPADLPRFAAVLGDGADLGIELALHAVPEDVGEVAALLGATGYLDGQQAAVARGGAFLHADSLPELLQECAHGLTGCVLFGHPSGGDVGLSLYNGGLADVLAELAADGRGPQPLEAVNRHYADRGAARTVEFGRGTASLDMATPDGLRLAAQFVHALEHRQSLRIACLEEVALRMGLIDQDQCALLGARMAASDYGRYVLEIAKEPALAGSHR